MRLLLLTSELPTNPLGATIIRWVANLPLGPRLAQQHTMS